MRDALLKTDDAPALAGSGAIPFRRLSDVQDSAKPSPAAPALSLRTPFGIEETDEPGYVRIIDADGGRLCERIAIDGARMLVTGANGYLATLGNLTEAEELMRTAHRDLRRLRDATFDAAARARIDQIFKPLDGYLYPGMMG